MKKIAVFGTGVVGQTLASRLSGLGHPVVVGTRDVAATLARSEKDNYGNPPFRDWAAQHPQITTATFAEAAAFGEMIVNCTVGNGSLDALRAAGADALNGKIMIDIANPLDFSQGFPPFLTIANTSSLAEVLQEAFPELRIVKTLNTMNAWVMVKPELVPGDHTVFMSGNDAEAKNEVGEILKSFGWQPKNIIDLGDITTARGTEMLLPIWVRLYGALQTPMFNFHIAK